MELCVKAKRAAAYGGSGGYSIDSEAKDILARGCDAFIQSLLACESCLE